MNKTNEFARKNTEAKVFVTVFFTVLDTRKRELTFCNAGHPSAILKTPKGIKMLEPNSTVIGIFENENFLEDKVSFKYGDISVFYSDGVTEAKRNGELFGEEHLIKLVRDIKTKNVKEYPEIIFNEINDFTKGKLEDDIVLLSVALKTKFVKINSSNFLKNTKLKVKSRRVVADILYRTVTLKNITQLPRLGIDKKNRPGC